MPDETQSKLKTMFAWSTVAGIDSAEHVRAYKTATGIKDGMQETFLQRVMSSLKNVTGATRRQTALDKEFAKLPSSYKSPVWRIKGHISLLHLSHALY